MASSNDQLVCPKCRESMEPVTVGGVTIDRCTNCHGIWLDKGERLALLKDKDAVAAVDIGSEEVGREHDAVTSGDCPRCGESLQHLRDRAQKHIGFEFCPACKGSFFDAGRLRDLSEFTLSERIRALFGK